MICTLFCVPHFLLDYILNGLIHYINVIICHEIRSGELLFLIRNIEVVIFAAAIERASGAWPMCQSPVPAESTVNLVAGSFDAQPR
jgi:hypothetical protein